MTNRRRKTKKNSRKCKHVRKKHKRKSTNATEQFTKRRPTNRNPSTSCEERVGSTAPGKSGLECSRYHDKVQVSCVGKAHLQYFEGYDDNSDDDDLEFLCTRCFRLDDNSSMDSESD